MVATYRWQLQNVGSGPAVNVVVADWHPGRRADSITSCFPISAGGHLELGWLRAGWELAAVYADVFGNTFSTRCSGSRNTLVNGNEFSEMVADTDQWVQQLLDGIPGGSPLRAGDLRGKTPWELDLMRNQIYARHGYEFRRADLSSHFKKQEWYAPSKKGMEEVVAGLAPRERYEAQLILDFQRRFGLLTDGTLAAPTETTRPNTALHPTPPASLARRSRRG
jgi:hypothetical protein